MPKKKSLGQIQGQLTGLPRQVKDLVADLHNLVLKWDRLNLQGFQNLKSVSDLKIQLLGDSDSSVPPEGTEHYSTALETACGALCRTLDEMDSLSEKLVKASQKLLKLQKLSTDGPPFLSWNVSSFASCAKEISDMHTKQLQMLRCIVESAAHIEHFAAAPEEKGEFPQSCRDVLMFYSSCWLHQPYINESQRDLLLQEMLMESGHTQV